MKIIRSLFFIIIVLLNSFAYANPVAVGDYDMSIFTMFSNSIGKTGSFILGLIFTIIMCFVMLVIVYKAFDLKNNPENIKRAIITFVIVLLCIGGGFGSLINQKNNHEMRYSYYPDNHEFEILMHNQELAVYFGNNINRNLVYSLVGVANRMNNENNHIVKLEGFDGVISYSGDKAFFHPLRNARYEINAKDYYEDGYIKTITIKGHVNEFNKSGDALVIN